MLLVVAQRCSDLAGQVIGEDLVGCGSDAIECSRGDQCGIVLATLSSEIMSVFHVADVQGGHGYPLRCEFLTHRVGLRP